MSEELGVRSEELLKESSVGFAHAALFDFCFTLRVGSESAGHLIHRGAVPLPLEGKDNAPPNLGRDCECRAPLSTVHCPLSIPLAD